MLAEKDFRPRRYVVLVNLPQEDFSCICPLLSFLYGFLYHKRISHLRFNLLSDRLIDIAFDGSKSNERYMMVVEDAKKIQEKLDAMSIAEEQEEVLRNQGSNAAARGPSIIDDGYANNLENHDVAKPRGRPTTAGRHKTLVEKFRTKQKITCSHCGSHEHNYATCDSKHLDKSNFQKKTASKMPPGPRVSKQKKSTENAEQSKTKRKSKGQPTPMDL